MPVEELNSPKEREGYCHISIQEYADILIKKGRDFYNYRFIFMSMISWNTSGIVALSHLNARTCVCEVREWQISSP